MKIDHFRRIEEGRISQAMADCKAGRKKTKRKTKKARNCFV